MQQRIQQGIQRGIQHHIQQLITATHSTTHCNNAFDNAPPLRTLRVDQEADNFPREQKQEERGHCLL